MTEILKIAFPSSEIDADIRIAGSKSESNRLLLIQAVSGGKIGIENLSDSDDTRSMQSALEKQSGTVDIGPAGTAMRFCTAFFSSVPGTEVIIQGSERMHSRPIYPLVDCLRSLGAEIEYLGTEGFPPLKITGKKLTGGHASIDGSVSSQFITALMLIAPALEKGLNLTLENKAVSVPYIEMTRGLLARTGIESTFERNRIVILSGQKFRKTTITVESDWSSASYYFSFAALSRRARIRLHSFRPDSLQGDARVREIYARFFGVVSSFEEDVLILTKEDAPRRPSEIEIDLAGTPDIAQTVAVTMAGLKIKGKLTGLGTLRVKETDRIAALKTELAQFGAQCTAGNDYLEITGFLTPVDKITLQTYDDHRMAMAFAPLALLHPFEIENPGVVSKSYPAFWDDFARLGGQYESFL